MKVLFVSYPHVGLGKGGMYYQIKKTEEALSKIGCVVDYHNFMNTSLEDYDICHFFATNSVNTVIIDECKKLNIPVVISTVFNVFSKSNFRNKLDVALSKTIPGFLSNVKQLDRSMYLFDAVIGLNENELLVLKSLFPQASDKMHLIPNGIDLKMQSNKTLAEKESNMVLNVGSLCPRKNQLNLIEAASGANWQLHLVGPKDDSNYAEDCLRRISELPNVFYYGELSYGSNELIDLYSRTKTFCLPSYSEVQPLTFIEAAQNNCRIVTGDTIPVQDFLKTNTDFANASSPNDIRNKIELSLQKRSTSKNEIQSQKSWDEIGLDIKCIYKSLVSFDE